MIFSIVWDLPDDPDGNVQHIAQNDISVAEVEEVLGNESNPVVVSRSSDRWMTFGWTSTGRYIAVAWDSIETDPLSIKPITAFVAQPPRNKRKRK